MSSSHAAGGGFLLSPAPSSVASTTSNTSALPHPRTSPLKPGGAKESAFIRYVDSQLLHIQRRFAKRTTPSHTSLSNEGRDAADVWGDVKGYSTMKEACKDISELVGVVWVSGTPSLQVPYLISMGLLVGSVVAGMPPSPRALFRLLERLDHAFASLLQGRDVDSGEALPGFEGMGVKGVSGTEKVRVRSLVERTRVGVMEALKRGEFEDEGVESEEEGRDRMDVDGDAGGELVLEGDGGLDDDDEEDSWDMRLARVYDRTIVELGDSLETPNIGIITEGRISNIFLKVLSSWSIFVRKLARGRRTQLGLGLLSRVNADEPARKFTGKGRVTLRRTFLTSKHVTAKKVNRLLTCTTKCNYNNNPQSTVDLRFVLLQSRSAFVFPLSFLPALYTTAGTRENMPTYHACGVTARLSTCDLKATLSGFVDLRMGGEQRKDAARIQKNLSGGEKLGERPIGPDGSERGVVQFIGVQEDLPLYMVEASAQLRKGRLGVTRGESVEECPLSGVPSSSDSPLTSLVATPTPTHDVLLLDPQLRDQTASKPWTSHKPQRRSGPQSSSQSTASTERHTFEQALQNAGILYTAKDQALVLDIQMEHESFLPNRDGSGSLGKDLKIEIFINGELVEVSFINARRSAAQIIGDKIRFAGTRVHRQTEKPWVYSPEDTTDEGRGAESRWSAVSRALMAQARLRGTDRFGDLQPSAEFLGALADLGLPERVKDIMSIGVVDVLITAGKGQKYGPETAYLTMPTRLDDPDFAISNPAVDPVLVPPPDASSVFDGGAVLSPFKAMSIVGGQPPESSPDVPLRSRLRMPSVSASPSPTKKAINLAREFGFDLTREEGKALTVGAYENARGKAGLEGRSLLQRLGDLKKMNADRQARELEKLREELGQFPDMRADSKQDKDKQRPAKRARTVSEAKFVNPSKTTAIDPHIMEIDRTMREDDVFGPGVIDPTAVLTQDRIDMALESGAASSGALLRRIASTSPVKTPRKTKASALAYSPTRVAIKAQKRGSTEKTPEKCLPNVTPSFSFDDAESTLLRTPKHAYARAAVSPTKSGRGANRTASKWDPKEQTFADALETFEIPEVSRGSCVTYPVDKQASRQIGKARGGFFKEEALLVGMRFCVW